MGKLIPTITLISVSGLLIVLTGKCDQDPIDPGPAVDTLCIPTLVSPKSNVILDNGCYGYLKDLLEWNFRWLGCGSSTKYRLFVSAPAATNPFIDVEVDGTIFNYSEHTFIKKNLNGWKWKVCSFINGKWGDWSDERIFNIEPASTDCLGAIVSQEMARDSLFKYMNDTYYWYNMPEIKSMTVATKNSYKEPVALLEAMRYKILDKYSFVAFYSVFHAYEYGEFVGHGISYGIDLNGKVRIASIYPRSPLYKEGVRRGWIIRKINNVEVAPLYNENDAISNLLGPREAGISNTFLFEKPSGETVEICSVKEPFTINCVIKADTLHLSNGIAGYLMFDSFTYPALEELDKTFAYFKQCGIKDLILDLRYNGGGSIEIALSLAGYIAGYSNQGRLFTKLQYNDQHPEKNFTYDLVSMPNSINIQSIAIITSHETASASELIINCLKPYINLVTVGDSTYGKPVGMDPADIGNSYTFLLAEFEVLNSQNTGGYYDGISPSKSAIDDLTHDFGDRGESCLKEAIYYLERGSFSAKGESYYRNIPVYSEKSSWWNNAFIGF